MKSFASDNNAPIPPSVLQALVEANLGDRIAYGDDPYTTQAHAQFQSLLGSQVETFFVFNGTGANVLGLQSMTKPHQAVLCSDLAHIQVDECGAPEKLTGCKLITIKNRDGKIFPEDLQKHLGVLGVQHHVQPKVVSISQTTELGTVYSIAEMKNLGDFCRKNGLYFHVDGARIANAVVSLGCDLKTLAETTGIDVLTFGGTKNGLMLGEAVVFFNSDLAADFKFIRKQGMQLCSKMRFISAQFLALLADDLWLKNATHANQMAKKLETELKKFKEIEISRPVQANAVFARLPRPLIERLQKSYYFYVWDDATDEVRWMTSFNISPTDVSDFTQKIEELLKD